ncbi:MAG: hypothetical protein OEW97_08200 [Gammaproteobacteria bacterium]|nr:hypothetical protein [Gammaproteobacteria bacterium]
MKNKTTIQKQPSKLLTAIIISLSTFLLSQPVMAAKFKCWKNKEGVKECGSYVPAEYSQKRIETRSDSGRVVEVKERAKNEEELAEEARLAELKKIEDAKIAEQKKLDSILLKTFTRERDITMLRDSKVNVIEGIITVTNSNNKALQKKLERLQKQAANIERGGKKPPESLVEDIKSIESTMKKNEESITAKRAEQETIRQKFKLDLDRFRILKNTPATVAKPK